MRYLFAGRRWPTPAPAGPDTTEDLIERADGADLGPASEAIAHAGRLAPDRAGPVLRRGLAHPNPVVRVAVAGALERQPELAAELMARLLVDEDPGVRMWALRTAERLRTPGLRRLIEDRAAREPLPDLAALAHLLLGQGPQPAVVPAES
ncbi:HEAT repeat domain-containing protein [Streptomyces sp. SBT349]|uniref:HEAT repeat domain-containing protein n=1 Tax=Streptomyces sp. SBT349 TaxID=1580539 RepID=UPI00066B449B|nr:HEAT repeat domain-containing protein [Streptomyces sp. SBT349]